MFRFMDSTTKFFIYFAVSGIETVITDHLEMFFRDMLNKKPDEIYCRESTSDISIVFMTVIVKSNIFTIVRINPF